MVLVTDPGSWLLLLACSDDPQQLLDLFGCCLQEELFTLTTSSAGNRWPFYRGVLMSLLMGVQFCHNRGLSLEAACWSVCSVNTQELLRLELKCTVLFHCSFYCAFSKMIQSFGLLEAKNVFLMLLPVEFDLYVIYMSELNFLQEIRIVTNMVYPAYYIIHQTSSLKILS